MKSASEILLGLVIAGALVSCRDHAKPDDHVTAKASIGCASCHTPELDAVKRPPHVGVRPTACGVCHSPSAWKPKRIDHAGWALTGAHARIAADDKVAGVEKQVKCFWCHRENTTTFKVANKTCVGCHASDLDRAVPPHDDFSTACQTCHSTEDWEGAKEPPSPKEPDPEPPPTAIPTASVDAGLDAGPPPKPKTPKPKPPKPPPKPPDVVTGPSGRHR